MSQLQDRIAQFRKMATEDPADELAQYRLGQLLQEAGQFADAIAAFRKTLELSPQFSKVYQLLAQCLLREQQTEEAVGVLRRGFAVADERGDNKPRDEMGNMLRELGEPGPISLRAAGAPTVAPLPNAFCQKGRCDLEKRAVSQQLAKPPFDDELGRKIYEQVCAGCWNDWIRNISVKVVNEMRLDLSSERGRDDYDKALKEILGIE